MSDNSDSGSDDVTHTLTNGSGDDDVCRDYLRKVCRRGKRCKYRHPGPAERGGGGGGGGGGGDMGVSAKPDPTFCHDFQNTGCHRPACRFLHCTRDEEELFHQTGHLPPRVHHAPQPAPSTTTTTTNNNNNNVNIHNGHVDTPVCRDFLKGECKRGSKCKYRHLHNDFPDCDVTPRSEGAGPRHDVRGGQDMRPPHPADLRTTHNHNHNPIHNHNHNHNQNHSHPNHNHPSHSHTQTHNHNPNPNPTHTHNTNHTHNPNHNPNHTHNPNHSPSFSSYEDGYERYEYTHSHSHSHSHAHSGPAPGTDVPQLKRRRVELDGYGGGGGGGYDSRYGPGGPPAPARPGSYQYQVLEEENAALRRRVEELKKQVSDLTATNEVLLEQNARLRVAKAGAVPLPPVTLSLSGLAPPSAFPAPAPAPALAPHLAPSLTQQIALNSDMATQHAALQSAAQRMAREIQHQHQQQQQQHQQQQHQQQQHQQQQHQAVAPGARPQGAPPPSTLGPPPTLNPTVTLNPPLASLSLPQNNLVAVSLPSLMTPSPLQQVGAGVGVGVCSMAQSLCPASTGLVSYPLMSQDMRCAVASSSMAH